jgi:hypothetical protein
MFGLVVAAMVGVPVLQQPTVDAPVYRNAAYGVSVPRPFDDWVFEPGTGRQTATVIFHPRGMPLSEQLWGALALTTFAGPVDVGQLADRRVRSTWRRLLGRDFDLLTRDTLTLSGWSAVHLGMAGTIAGRAVEVDEYVIARDSDLILLQLRCPDDLIRDSIAAGYGKVVAGLRIGAPGGGAAPEPAPPLLAAVRAASARLMPSSPWRISSYDALVRYDAAGPGLEFTVRAEMANAGAATSDSVPVWLWPGLVWDSARAAAGAPAQPPAGAVAWVALPHAVEPGGRTSVTFTYHASEVDSDALQVTGRGAFAVTDWLPRTQPALDTAGQLTPASRPPFVVTFDLPEGWRAVAPGRVTSEAVWRGRRRTTWRSGEVRPAVPVFSLAPYEVATGFPGRVPVAIWSAPDDALSGPALDSLASAVGAAWRFCARAFGRLPIGEVEVAIAPLSSPVGSPGLVLLDRATVESLGPSAPSPRTADQAREALIREIARTWWGGAIVAAGPGSGWITESFPAWTAVAALGALEGDSARQRLVGEAVARWRSAAAGNDLALASVGPFGAGQALLDSKGVVAIEAARRAMGEARFREALFALALEHRHATLTLEQVRAALGAAGAAALRPFLF